MVCAGMWVGPTLELWITGPIPLATLLALELSHSLVARLTPSHHQHQIEGS